MHDGDAAILDAIKETDRDAIKMRRALIREAVGNLKTGGRTKQ